MKKILSLLLVFAVLTLSLAACNNTPDETPDGKTVVRLGGMTGPTSIGMAKLLADEGAKPEDEGALTKLSAKWGTFMNTVRDSTTSHLAAMMIEGATMGVNEMTRKLREAENSNVSESALRLTRDVCAFEEKIAREMKSYL